MWDTNRPRQLPGHDQAVSKIVFSDDGLRALTSSRDSFLTLWDSNSYKKLSILSGHTAAVNSCCFISSDGSKAMSVSDDMRAIAWDTIGGTVIKTQTAHKKPIYSCASGLSSGLFATGAWDSTVKLWSLKSKDAAKSLTGHTDWINDIVFTEDCAKLLTCSHDCTLRLWETRSTKCTTVLAGHSNWVLSCDIIGNTIASACYDGTAAIWDLRKPSQPISILAAHQGRVNSCALTKDGSHLITTSNDRKVFIWNTTKASVVATYVCKGYGTAVSVDSGSKIAVGDSLGNVYFLEFNH